MRVRMRQREHRPLPPGMLRVAAPSPTKARDHRRRRGSPPTERTPARIRVLIVAAWRRRFRLAFGGAVAGSLVVAAAALLQSGMLDVRRVTVEGAEVLNTRVLVDISGLRGASLFTANLDEAERRLEEQPLIADAEVTRDWPFGVTIRVTEREAWAVWSRDGVRYVVDQDGQVLRAIDPPPGAAIIIDLRLMDEADPIETVPVGIVKTAHDLQDFLPAVVGLTPRSFRIEDERGLIVTTEEGYAAVLGDGQDFDYKLGVWRALLDAARAEELPDDWVRLVDLRFGDHPSLVTAIGEGVAEEEAAESVEPLEDTALPDELEEPETIVSEEEPLNDEPEAGGLAAGDLARGTE